MDFLKDGEWVMALMGGFQGFKEQDFHGDIRSTRSACYEYMIGSIARVIRSLQVALTG